MDCEDIIRMAREAEFKEGEIAYMGDNFIRFAALVAAHEREACAKVCDVEAGEPTEGEWTGCARYLANKIRARGEK